MCNPRRVHVTATRPIAEAWRREISRVASLTERVVGEVRARPPLGTMGDPVIRALESRLATGERGWRQVEDGYRCDVEGGYVQYIADDRALLLVATAEDDVRAEGRASEILEGIAEGSVEASGEGRYYDDGFGGWTKERGEREALEQAQDKLDEAVRDRVAEHQRRAEQDRDRAVRERALADARSGIERQAYARRETLVDEARSRFEAVGVRGRRAFNEVLSRAYKDAILAYARRNGAEGVRCDESGDTMAIEFLVRR